MLKIFLEKNQENGPVGKKKKKMNEREKIERAMGVGRRTRNEIVKWNEMTALRFQTGGRHQTSPASLRGLQQGETQITKLQVNGWLTDQKIPHVTFYWK